MIVDSDDQVMARPGLRAAYRYKPCPCCKKPICLVHDMHFADCTCRKEEGHDYDYQEYDGILYATRRGTP